MTKKIIVKEKPKEVVKPKPLDGLKDVVKSLPNISNAVLNNRFVFVKIIL